MLALFDFCDFILSDVICVLFCLFFNWFFLLLQFTDVISSQGCPHWQHTFLISRINRDNSLTKDPRMQQACMGSSVIVRGPGLPTKERRATSAPWESHAIIPGVHSSSVLAWPGLLISLCFRSNPRAQRTSKDTTPFWPAVEPPDGQWGRAACTG